MKDILKKFIPKFFKKKINSILKRMRFKNFKEDATLLTLEMLIFGFKQAGIQKGDTLFVHSSLKGLGYIENGAPTIIEALKLTLGKEGTLIFPTFTINNSMLQTLSDKASIFNPQTSSSTVGSITNHFLKSANVVRSIHPTHSVAAWGKYAQYITSHHYELNTNFGKKTPFGKFLELNGKLMGLGINYAPVTFYHTYEDLDLSKFPDVYLPDELSSKVVSYKGETISCKTLCHNPEFHKTRIEKDPKVELFFRNYFEKNNISHTTQIGDGQLWWMYSRDVIKELDILYRNGKTIYNV